MVRCSISIGLFNLNDAMRLEDPWRLWNITGVSIRDKDNRVIDGLTSHSFTHTGVKANYTLFDRTRLNRVKAWWRKFRDSEQDRVMSVKSNFNTGEVQILNYSLPPDSMVHLHVTCTARLPKRIYGA